MTCPGQNNRFRVEGGSVAAVQRLPTEMNPPET